MHDVIWCPPLASRDAWGRSSDPRRVQLPACVDDSGTLHGRGGAVDPWTTFCGLSSRVPDAEDYKRGAPIEWRFTS